jgi:hypothetical protein
MKLAKILERLSEMFPRQDYYTRLERYVASKNPDSISEIEYLCKKFEYSENRPNSREYGI